MEEKPTAGTAGDSDREEAFGALVTYIVLPPLAIASFALLAPYTGVLFWLLLAIHVLLAALLGTIIVRLTGGSDDYADIGIPFVFLFSVWVGIAHLSSVANNVSRPLAKMAAPVITPVADLQTALINGALNIIPGDFQSITGDITRRINHLFLGKSDWDKEPMAVDAAIAKIELLRMIPEAGVYRTYGQLASRQHVETSNHFNVWITVKNNTNGAFKTLKAEINVGGMRSKVLEFGRYGEILPGQTGRLGATIEPAFAVKVMRRNGGMIEWTSKDISMSIKTVDLRRFDRQAHISRNLDKWLAE